MNKWKEVPAVDPYKVNRLKNDAVIAIMKYMVAKHNWTLLMKDGVRLWKEENETKSGTLAIVKREV